MALDKEAAFAYRVMVQAEQAWTASFPDAEVYDLGPERDHFGETLPCRRRVVLARNSEIPDMSRMIRARENYADLAGVIEDGKAKTSGPGSRAVSPIMRYKPGAPGHRVALRQVDDVMRNRVLGVVHTETDAYRGGSMTVDDLVRTFGPNSIEIDGVTHLLHHNENGRPVGPEGMIFRERSGSSHRFSLLNITGYRHQVRVATVLVVGASADVTVTKAPPRPRRSKYEVEFRKVGEVKVSKGSFVDRVLTAYLPR